MDSNALISLFAFSVLTVLWLAFGYALLFRRPALAQAWQVFRRWPLPAQIILALLILPVILGIWVWNAKWPIWLRLLLIAGLAWVTEYTFFPTAAF